jgi:hypothetical protein
MTWIETRWGAIAVGTALFLVGITLGASGESSTRTAHTARTDRSS